MKKIIVSIIAVFVMAQIQLSGDITRKGKKAKPMTKKVKAVLNWPSNNGDRLVKAKHIKTCLTDNANFVVPWPSIFVTLVNFGLHIEAFDAALASGDADLIQSTEIVVHDDCMNLMPMVQAKMDSDKPNAANICTGAGYDVGKKGGKGERKNTIKPGNEPGSVVMTGVGSGHHDWEISYDGGVTPVPVDSTSSGKTTLDGLKPKTDIWQHNRLVLTKGRHSDWTPWVPGTTK